MLKFGGHIKGVWNNGELALRSMNVQLYPLAGTYSSFNARSISMKF